MQRNRRRLLLPRRGPTPSVRGSAAKTSITPSVTVAQADFSSAPQPGDLLLAFASTASDDPDLGSSGFGITGWTQILGGGGSTPTGSMSVFWRAAGGSEGSYVFDTGGNSQANVVQVVAVKDVPPVGALDSYALATGTSLSAAVPLVSASRPGCLSVIAGAAAWASTGVNAWTPPAGLNAHTELHDSSVDQTAFTVSGCVDYKAGVLAGSSGVRNLVLSRLTPAWTATAAVIVRGL